VPDHEPQPREPVEHPGRDDPQQVHARLDAEPEDRAVQARLVQGLDHPVGGGVRVQVDRHVEPLGGLQHGPEPRVVEIAALHVRVGDHPAHAESGDGAFQLGDRRVGVLPGDGGERGEPVGVVAHGLRGHVVGERRHRPGGRGIQDVRARRGERDDLVVDARCGHVGQALGAEVGQPAHHGARPLRRAAEVETPQALEALVALPVPQQAPVELQQLGRGERLLGGDPSVPHPQCCPVTGCG
jgi:hypothetical protein